MNVDPGRLTHWTRVAFAAQCARRVQARFTEAWPDLTLPRTARKPSSAPSVLLSGPWQIAILIEV
jgi:hypothetical protein